MVLPLNNTEVYWDGAISEVFPFFNGLGPGDVLVHVCCPLICSKWDEVQITQTTAKFDMIYDSLSVRQLLPGMLKNAYTRKA